MRLWSVYASTRHGLLRRTGWLALLGTALLCSACGTSGRRPVYPVHGQVLWEGKPLANAQVVFHPLADDDKEHPVRPIGRVTEDGSFQLTTYGAADGAPAGSYAVTVSFWQRLPGQPEGDLARNVLPPRYTNPQTSPLRVDIGKGTNELLPFQLTRR